jgi:hypothetical protein
MAPGYTLQPDEWVVIEAERGVHHLAPRGLLEQTFGSKSETVVLTNRNVIVVSMSTWGNPKGTSYYPLNQIKVADGHPQIVVTSRSGRSVLDIHFQSGVETFAFRNKRDRSTWSESISKLLAGGTDIGVSAARDNKAIPGMAYVAGTLKDTFGAVKTSLGLDLGSRSGQAAGKCAACGAPLSGHTGAVIRCQYCDSDQQL